MKVASYILLVCSLVGNMYAQGIGIGTESPDTSAILDIHSTNKGILVPRMSASARTAIAAPADGLMVFDTTTHSFWFYRDTAWIDLSSAPRLLSDADGDTRIQVEKNADEDIIRLEIGGSEKVLFQRNPSGVTRMAFVNQSNNVCIGEGAGAELQGGGHNNTAIGVQALSNATTGYQNTAIGRNALRSNTTGGNNIGIGYNALYSVTSGLQNIAVGGNCGTYTTTGTDNVAMGSGALMHNVANSRSTAIGVLAMNYADNRTTGRETYNTAVGCDALRGSQTPSNNTGRWNTAIGDRALWLNTSGNYNVGVGRGSLANNSSGSENTGLGTDALQSNTTGDFNAAVGTWCLYFNTTGSNNAATGSEALLFNTTGALNTAVGRLALRSNVGNRRSTAVGYCAMLNADSRTTGQDTYNTAVGTEALRGSGVASNNTGVQNTAIGDQALYNTSSGGGNTGVGKNALISNVTGVDNAALGAHANVSAGNLNSAAALGTWSTVNASNKIRVGNSSVTVIEGQVAWTHPSDGRFKFNVHEETVPGLSLVNRLRPVTYQFDTRKFEEHVMQHLPDSIRRERLQTADYAKSSAMVQTGFIAQEVEQACRELGYEFSGLHVPGSDVDNYGIAYASFVPVLVKAIQEQQAIMAAQQATIDDLQARMTAMESALLQMASSERD